ncbi:MAG: BspA family leucine-rich repeat surface protein [Lachnospiraceae bacterium]|nr:BspA family leucine-rich repeat surface protein [Lachnospiraceae bacterium]
MRKTSLLKKRILALALSVSMVFASMDTYVAMAAEAPDMAGDADVETEAGLTSESAVSDDIDPISQSDMEEEAETEEDSDASGENGSSNDSDAEENSDSLTDESKIDKETDNSELTEGDAVTSDVDETSEDEAQLLADENAEDTMPIAEGDIAGGVIDEEYGNITWVIDGDGKLTVTGTGDFSSPTSIGSSSSSRVPWYSYRNDIKSAEIKVTGMTDASYMFWECKMLNSIDLSSFDTSKVTNMHYMFYHCETLGSIDVSSLDTSQVKDMYGMFHSCKSLGSIDVSSFETSQLRDIRWMFYDCENLSSIDLSSFDTGELRYISRLFQNCKTLSSIDVSSFNTSQVTEMGWVFYGCENLSSIDLSSFDTSNATSVSEMFYGCNNLYTIYTPLNLSRSISLPQGTWYKSDETAITALPQGLGYSIVITKGSIPATGPYITAYKSKIVYKCGDELNLEDLRVKYIDNEGKVTAVTEYNTNADEIDMSTEGSKTLTITYNELACEIELTVNPVRSYITATKKKTVYKCGDVIDLGDLAVVYHDEDGKVTPVTESEYSTNASSIDMSTEGTKTLTITYNELTYEIKLLVYIDAVGIASGVIDEVYGHIVWMIDVSGKLTVTGTGDYFAPTSNGFSLADVIPWYRYRNDIKSAEIKVTGMTNASYMFYDCDALSSIDVSGFDVSQVTNMRYLFYGCKTLSSIDISSFYTDRVTDMQGMFSGCETLSSIDVSKFDTSQVIDMCAMFSNCKALSSIDLGSFDTSHVTKMNSMFSGCEMLSSIDVSKFDTRNVTNMKSMFSGCERLSSIDIDVNHFATGRVTDMSYMFDGCDALSSIDVSSFDTSKVTDMSRMFYGCKALSSIDLSNFKTSQVTQMISMFGDCETLSSIDVSSFDTSKVTRMLSMFRGCNNLKSIDLSGFDTSQVKSMDNIFLYCYALSTIHTPLNLNLSVSLPEGTWYRNPEGTVVTELPQGLSSSIVITKNHIIGQPYITATKTKTIYERGDELNLDDLTVEYHDAEEEVTPVTEYSTNADTINMRTEGTKTLVITYNDSINELKCQIILTVTKKSGSEDSQDPDNETGFHIRFVNEEDKESVYTGAAIKPAIEVTYNGYELIEGIDYTVKYSNNVKASENAKVTVTGKGSYTGKTSETFTIGKQSLSDSHVEITGVELDENGNMVLDSAGSPTLLVVEKTKASPVLIYYGVKLTSKDFTVEGNQKWTGNGVVTIKAKDTGNFSGERKLNIKVISKKDLKKFTVTVDKSVTYDGEAHKLIPVVKDSKTKENLAETDYIATYSKDVTNAGTVKVTVAGRGYYTGSVTKSYKIKPIAAPATDMEVDLSNKTGYTFKPNGVILKKDDITVKYKGKTEPLVYGTDYKVTCSSNKKVGDKAKYKVTFLGNYKGSKALSGNFKINKATLNDENDGLKVSVLDKVYTGKPGIYKSAPYVSMNGVSLKSSDYTVTYWADSACNTNEIKGKQNNITVTDEPVTVYVKIVAKGNNYETPDGTYAKGQYKVYPKPSDSRYDLSKAKITLTFKDKDGNIVKKPEFIGDGIEVKPAEIKVECKSGKTWVTVPATEYTVEYVNNVYKGKATVLIKANSTVYAGSKAVKFSIGAYNLNILRLFL